MALDSQAKSDVQALIDDAIRREREHLKQELRILVATSLSDGIISHKHGDKYHDFAKTLREALHGFITRIG